MVSFYLLQRGLYHFTLVGTNFLPLLKHAMDLYFQKKWAGHYCEKIWFPSTCFDDVATDFTMYTEVGCANIVALLTWIIIGYHTILCMYHLGCSVRGKSEGFLAGTEYGCCGASAVVIGFVTIDSEVEAARAGGMTWRRGARFISAGFIGAIIVTVCSSIHIVSGPDAWDIQKTSLFVLLPCLFLNLASFIESFYEAVVLVYT
ncbi:hypothetical protein HK097_000879 [Rhizophlyctis rosea]|uniref:Uncharacterized protein n=1 Tax=Rhizophlyctis rosea TaxID=64517 RepID=A0AAD5S671_9FUNG|nr:hypothetical protein HK097_000879 [Rhizophlyctis rosea]